MDVLVTGATGFIAGHLIPHLVAAGHRVVAAGHDPARLDRFSGVQPLLWDLRVAEEPADLPARLDAVIHLAQANVPFPDAAAEMFAIHVAATQRLLDIARRTSAQRFVLASSGSVYGGGERPWTEDDPAEGAGYYAASKVAAERLVRAYGDLVPHTIFRLFTPYGPGQIGRMVPGLIDRVRRGVPVTVAGGTGPWFSPLYITHVVDALTQALDARESHIVNLCGDEVLAVRDMAGTIGRVLGCEPAIAETDGTAEHIAGDITRLRATYRLPARLVTFEEGIRSMVTASGPPRTP